MGVGDPSYTDRANIPCMHDLLNNGINEWITKKDSVEMNSMKNTAENGNKRTNEE